MAPTPRKNRTDVFSLEPEYPFEPKKKIYLIEFDREVKREINAYKLKAALEHKPVKQHPSAKFDWYDM